MTTIPIGLQLYSVRDDCARDLPDVLKAVADMGYVGVEFAGYYGYTAPELRALLDDNGLNAVGRIRLWTPFWATSCPGPLRSTRRWATSS